MSSSLPRPTRSVRLQRTFTALAAAKRVAFIPYITAGDPDLPTCGAILDALANHGADVIEVGVPFSDPMADGPTIQAAMLRALEAGTTLAQTFELIREFRKSHDTPIVLFGYWNPILRMGVARAVAAAAEAGVDAFLVVDLPPEEAEELTPHLEQHALDFISLFTPTSHNERIPAIAAAASGFAYYVSMAGTTGEALTRFAPVAERVKAVRAATGLPVAVGFGIRDGAGAREVARFADGVVIGSGLVEAVAAAPSGPAKVEAARAFAIQIRSALDAERA